MSSSLLFGLGKGPFFGQHPAAAGAALDPTAEDAAQGIALPENPKPLPKLFQPISIRGLTVSNRLWVSPMCMYSATDGHASGFHFAHYGQFAMRGAGLVMVEATGVLPEGRVTPGCLGLWHDKHVDGLCAIVDYMHSYGTAVGIQLSHSGRMGSSIPLQLYGQRPSYKCDVSKGGWPAQVYGPSAIPFSDQFWEPTELTVDQIIKIQQAFADAAVRADRAGFDVLDIHAAYGFLLNQFLSPTSNHRTDQYGGTFENRMRMLLETIRKVRQVWPGEKPMFVSIPATEGVAGGWDVDDTVRLAALLADEGVDLSEYSVGGNSADATVPGPPSARSALTATIKQRAPKVLVGAVGLINNGKQANQILEEDKADVVFSARQFLRNPSFVLSAAYELGVNVRWADQYECARPKLKYSFF